MATDKQQENSGEQKISSDEQEKNPEGQHKAFDKGLPLYVLQIVTELTSGVPENPRKNDGWVKNNQVVKKLASDYGISVHKDTVEEVLERLAAASQAIEAAKANASIQPNAEDVASDAEGGAPNVRAVAPNEDEPALGTEGGASDAEDAASDEEGSLSGAKTATSNEEVSKPTPKLTYRFLERHNIGPGKTKGAHWFRVEQALKPEDVVFALSAIPCEDTDAFSQFLLNQYSPETQRYIREAAGIRVSNKNPGDTRDLLSATQALNEAIYSHASVSFDYINGEGKSKFHRAAVPLDMGVVDGFWYVFLLPANQVRNAVKTHWGSFLTYDGLKENAANLNPQSIEWPKFHTLRVDRIKNCTVGKPLRGVSNDSFVQLQGLAKIMRECMVRRKAAPMEVVELRAKGKRGCDIVEKAFSSNPFYKKLDEGYYRVFVSSEGILEWAMGKMDIVAIEKPQELRNKVIRCIKRSKYLD